MVFFRLDDNLPWLLPALLTLAATLILGTAWVSELYGANLRIFENRNLDPCQLCIVQRYPYALLVVLGAAGVLLSRQAMERTLLLSVMAVVLVFGSYVSGFHVGVEYGWWMAGGTCTGGGSVAFDLSEQLVLSSDPINLPAPANCSEAAWRFPGENGLSMAGYNFLLSTGLAIGTMVFAFASLRRLPRES